MISHPTERSAAPLTDADIAFGVPLGYDAEPPLARANNPVSPRAAFESVLATALRRPPCAVSFSGGRDSSALLAIAVGVARREGLRDPVPVTLRFPESAAANETEWQELVLGHLRLDDWMRIDVIGDEFDAVGPLARSALRRHGLLWPFNTHFHLPIMRAVAGGSLVTGFGGDEIGLSSATARAEQVLARRRRPARSDVLTVGLALSPRPVRKAVHRRRVEPDAGGLPWLTPQGRRTVTSLAAADLAAVPLGWAKVLREAIWRRRYFTVCQQSFAAMGAGVDVQVHHPFVSGPVLDALAHAGGFGGLGSRADIMRLLCGDDLPASLLTRRSKSTFSAPAWTTTARAFARAWSGEGINRDLVSVDALRSHWESDRVNLLSATLLQAAWLHDHGSTGEQTLPTKPTTKLTVNRRGEEQGHGLLNV